jgi:hypothetical protein
MQREKAAEVTNLNTDLSLSSLELSINLSSTYESGREGVCRWAGDIRAKASNGDLRKESLAKTILN